MSTTMHFGPEWMRTKQPSTSRPATQSSPPPTNGPPSGPNNAASSSQNSSSQQEKRDNPPLIRYSKEELLRIYRENGGKVGVGVDSDRWDAATTHEPSSDAQTRDSNDDEKKRFGGPLGRRQSSDFLSSSTIHSNERPRLNQSTSVGGASPLKERFGGLITGRRRESTDQNPTNVPRKLSLSTSQGSLGSRDVGLPSPRNRLGSTNVDGVLSSGDSWVARRRASEAALKFASGAAGGPAPKEGSGTADSNNDVGATSSGGLDKEGKTTKDPTPPPQSAVASNGGFGSTLSGSTMQDLSSTSLSNLSVMTGSTSRNVANNVGPPGVVDFAAVEWSYLDPTGQVQGPFRADQMQKWHDDGYFTPDLLMKRTQMDKDWITVAELARRTGSTKLFLTPIPPPPPAGPPGLTRLTESPLQSFITPTDIRVPHQPAPLRSLRASALETFVGNGSNASDSPSSSLGAGRSQDPSAFGGRAGRRNVYMDGFSSGSSELAASGLPHVDNYGYPNAYGSSSSPWPTSNHAIGSAFNSTGDRFPPDPNAGSYLTGSAPGSSLNGIGHYGGPQYPDNTASIPGSDYALNAQRDGYTHYDSSASNNPYGSPAMTNQFNQFLAQQQPPYQNAYGSANASKSSLDHESPMLAHNSPAWPSQESSATVRRPGPFEANHPTSRNTTTNVQQQASAWMTQPTQPSPQSAVTDDPSPWFSSAPQANGTVAAAQQWPPAPTDIDNGLTISNVIKHNQQQEEVVATPIEPIPQEIPRTVQPPSRLEPEVIAETKEAAPPTELASAPIPAVSASAPTPKSRKSLSHLQATQPPVNKLVIPAADVAPSLSPSKSVTPPPSQPAAAAAKPAWSNDVEPKKKISSGGLLSLREIQEAEAKKAEAKKAAEREKERAARLVASTTPSEETVPFIATWGLSGARGTAKDTSISTIAAAPTPTTVWTATKPPTQQKKKTMKEIQEEEEKRKAQTIAKPTAAVVAVAAGRRGYAESTSKTAPASGAPTPGSAWSTVGAGGKITSSISGSSTSGSTPVASVVNSRPTISTANSSTAVSSSGSAVRVNGGLTAHRPAATPVPTKSVSVSRIVDDQPVAPSHEFVKWLNDSLKGLNSSVNVEEIMSMLLTFPVDADASTLEIISDLIYANSTTLDGRRFAAEFSSKRKADATSSRSKINGTSGGASKVVSIADVVKAQPKPTQPEWGGFKVVNKKKKGGRA